MNEIDKIMQEARKGSDANIEHALREMDELILELDSQINKKLLIVMYNRLLMIQQIKEFDPITK